MDLFVVPTIGFKLLYGFVIVRIDRLRTTQQANYSRVPQSPISLAISASADCKFFNKNPWTIALRY